MYNHDTMRAEACAWCGEVRAFLAEPEEAMLLRLRRFAVERGTPQVIAWDRSIGVLREQLSLCMPEAAACGVVLEFELPRCGGARPDLIILENGTVLVVEFKNRVDVEEGDVDQVLGYVSHLGDYHAGCRGKTLVPVLIPVGYSGPERGDGGGAADPGASGGRPRLGKDAGGRWPTRGTSAPRAYSSRGTGRSSRCSATPSMNGASSWRISTPSCASTCWSPAAPRPSG